MKKIFSIALLGCMLCSGFASCSSDNDDEPSTPSTPTDQPKWNLVWQDNFDSPTLNEQVWSRTDRGTPDWANTQSKDDRCFGWSDGNLILKGIVNPDTDTDPSAYLTGGIWTRKKMAFGPSEADQSPVSIQVRARLGAGATGAWPAIWMMPFAEDKGWPECGEVDIMERLNKEQQIYQTLHSAAGSFTQTTYFKQNDFHVFEVQLWPDEVKYYLDHILTFTYKKEANGGDNQFPYFKEWYLIIDMQLGGSWVGEVDPTQLPVEMEVDWVRYYRYK